MLYFPTRPEHRAKLPSRKQSSKSFCLFKSGNHAGV